MNYFCFHKGGYIKYWFTQKTERIENHLVATKRGDYFLTAVNEALGICL